MGDHNLCLLTGEIDKLATGIGETAAVVPGHYAAEEQVSRALARLGKPAAAALIEGKLPTTKGIRSGDLGEIYATEWIDAHCNGYLAPIKRLRWKDHRNMAMRGDDVIAINVDPESQRLRFLKTEAKSPRQVDRPSACRRPNRAGQGWRPSIGTCARIYFGPARSNSTICRLLMPLMMRCSNTGIPIQNVRHLLFTFSDNDPSTLLTASLEAYQGTIPQLGVGFRVDGHATFVGAVYERVIANANNA